MWIPVQQELLRHPKTRKLARFLNTSMHEAVGYLIFLWSWAADYAKDGNISKYSPEDIADGCFLLPETKPEEFYNLLLASGFLVKNGNDVFINDWQEYAGKNIKKMGEDAERKRRNRDKKRQAADVQRMSRGCPEDVQRMSEVDKIRKEKIREDNIRKDKTEDLFGQNSPEFGPTEAKPPLPQNQPSPIPPYKQKLKKKYGAEKFALYESEFKICWSDFPRKEGAQEALQYFCEYRAAGYEATALHRSIKNYKNAVDSQNQNNRGQFIRQYQKGSGFFKDSILDPAYMEGEEITVKSNIVSPAQSAAKKGVDVLREQVEEKMGAFFKQSAYSEDDKTITVDNAQSEEVIS